jgi:protease-4
MKNFFKMVFATMVGVLIASFLFFFIAIGIITAMVASEDKVVEVKSNTILKLTLDNPIIERSENNPLEGLEFQGFGAANQDGLLEIVENIKKAKDDPNISGIYLELTYISAQLGTIQEIRHALADFRKSGKFIIAYSDYMAQTAYYLSSVADQVILNPQGTIDFLGARSEVMFFKGSLEKLGVEAEVIRHGKFKSAIEPFTEEKMSAENKQQISVLLNSMWNNILHDISKNRKLSIDRLNQLANSMALASADSCLSSKAVDYLLYKDQVDSLLIKSAGQSGKKPVFISLGKYKNVPKQSTGKGFASNKIAVVYAYGEVVMGDAGEGNVSAKRISEALRSARTDTSIKAIVLRVNSPGGSALASDIIWREVDLASKVKPVVASMGDLAASGGYYISCAADTIVAQPSTITGSIGVFGVLFNAKKLLNQKLGITSDVVKTNDHSDFPSISRPIDPQERLIFQREIERIYSVFISHVADGRNMEVANVDQIGQGRVWSGTDAIKIGLVDTLGYLDDAIKIAARLAKIDHYRITNLPKLEDPIERIIKELTGEVKQSLIKAELGENYKYVEMAKKLQNIKGAQTRLPFELQVY